MMRVGAAARLRALAALRPQARSPRCTLHTGSALSAEAGKKAKAPREPYVLRTAAGGVTTLVMNRPKQLNGWTEGMMAELFSLMEAAAGDADTKAVVLSGKGSYYCAGVNLSGSLTLMAPAKLHTTIFERNKAVFDAFIAFPKPIVVALNGPAIGASVTTATLCDAIVALDSATLSTPFARLGIPPEGCSSVHFERIMGGPAATRMLGPDGFAPTAREAHDLGFVHQVVKAGEGGVEAGEAAVVAAAQELAATWAKDGKARCIPTREGEDPAQVVAEYKAVNERESRDLATAFLSRPFLDAQRDFLASKGKTGPSLMFGALSATRPLWAAFLPAEAR